VKAQKEQDEFGEPENSHRCCYGKRASRLVAIQTGQEARLPGQAGCLSSNVA
jgi:hypothetical protein